MIKLIKYTKFDLEAAQITCNLLHKDIVICFQPKTTKDIRFLNFDYFFLPCFDIQY